ncbi:MAG: CBS domain-containing protein, partial [Candidatus Xenobia bacterium]
DRCDAVLQRLTGDVCVVVSEERVVLGQVSRARLQATGNTLVERVMEPGPTTRRPSETMEQALKKVHDPLVVTDSDGVLMGLVTRADLMAYSREAAKGVQ